MDASSEEVSLSASCLPSFLDHLSEENWNRRQHAVISRVQTVENKQYSQVYDIMRLSRKAVCFHGDVHLGEAKDLPRVHVRVSSWVWAQVTSRCVAPTGGTRTHSRTDRNLSGPALTRIYNSGRMKRPLEGMSGEEALIPQQNRGRQTFPEVFKCPRLKVF